MKHRKPVYDHDIAKSVKGDGEFKKEFNLVVFGSRGLYDERVKIIILENIKKFKPTTILTAGEPSGVCEMARFICKEIAIPLKLHFINFKYLRGAFNMRSQNILEEGDYLILIHDGKSKGTANEKVLADKMKIPYEYYLLDPAKFDVSNGFDIIEDWDLIDKKVDLMIDDDSNLV